MRPLATTRPTQQPNKNTLPLTIEEARTWLRLDDKSEDPLIAALITAATQRAEESTRRALIDTNLVDHFPTWPTTHTYTLAKATAHTLTSIQYFDTAGTLQTIHPDSYTFQTIDQGIGAITFLPSFKPPSLHPQRQLPIQAHYTAGYGTTPKDIPETLRTAVRFLLAHYYENRTPINIGNIVNPIPETVTALLDQHRLYTGTP